MSEHLCPTCSRATTYQVFSGGQEWYCESCDMDGTYPEDQTPHRAKMLQSEAGRIALRAEMDQELVRRQDAALLEREDLRTGLQQMRDGLATPLTDEQASE